MAGSDYVQALRPRTKLTLRQFASPRLTLAGIALFAIGAWAVPGAGYDALLAAGLPLLLLAVNLMAALLTNPRLRASLPLSLLHLALLACIVTAGAERAGYFDSLAAVTVGDTLGGEFADAVGRTVRPTELAQLRFRNEGFVEHYGNADRYLRTENRISYLRPDGTVGSAVIGDDRPLLLGRFRIYTSAGRGYAARFRWDAADGSIEFGSVQLPAPGLDLGPLQPLTSMAGEFQPFTAAQPWTLPSGDNVWTLLDVATPDTERATTGARENRDADGLEHQLVVRMDDNRFTLRPGDEVQLPAGTLTYLGLSAWMGYRIVSNDYAAWLLAACVLAAVAMGWFYGARFLQTSWLRTGTDQ